MNVKHVEDFGDSLLVVLQVTRKYQCIDGSQNAYLDKCQDIIGRFDEFSIHHIYRHGSSKAIDLAPQASSYNVSNKNFSITKKLMYIHVQNLGSLTVLGIETGLTGSPIDLTGTLEAHTGLTGPPTGLIGLTVPGNPILENSASNGLQQDKADVIGCRGPIIDYL
jgi:hypothetical protein